MAPPVIIENMIPRGHIIIIILLVGMLPCLPATAHSDVPQDSLIMDKVYAYRRDYSADPTGCERNIYMKFNFHTLRRNPTMMLVPTLYHISKGNRDFVGEMYGKILFDGIADYDIRRQVDVSTIPHHSNTMPTMIKYIVPNLYGVTLFQDYMLSPFHKSNRMFYRYHIGDISADRFLITFWPKVNNTQLVRGFAIVDSHTGRIINTRLNGEYDMIKFDVDADMGAEGNSIIPCRCVTDAEFNFVGNKVKTRFTSYIGLPATLPDSIDRERDMGMMGMLRPLPLEDDEVAIYEAYKTKQTEKDSMTTANGSNGKKFDWDAVGDYVFNTTKASNENASIRFSPLLNPLYFGYSGRKGLSYKMKIGAEYRTGDNSKIALSPKLGYNFKIEQFYFDIPLRYTFNDRRDGYVELSFANGNRITSSTVLDMLQTQHRDTVDWDALDLDYFKDTHLNLSANMRITKQIELTLSLLYYRRSAVNKEAMRLAGKPTIYRSFSPALTVKYQLNKYWPMVTFNYERSVKDVLSSNTEYEKFEADASYKLQLHSLRKVNMRVGGGFYSNQSENYFVDFTNFHEDYLPGGWDDDWTGEFQLLNTHWYNASRYYLRANLSYESPLLLLTWLPIVGKFVEMERAYLGYVQLDHTRPYYEIGYGLTTRYFSMGLFASFLNSDIQDIGFKFTLELFRKW